MANNQYVNKVIYGNQTLIDLSSDTIAANKMLSGYTAHDKSGAIVTGTIPTKDQRHVIEEWGNSTFAVTVQAGYYAQSTGILLNTIYVEPPSSGTNMIKISVPNGTISPQSAEDVIVTTFTVDSSGTSNVTNNLLDATGASF